jgi:hypothetical protein
MEVMKMKTRCPFCDRKYDLGRTPLGGKVKCFGCNNSFILPTSLSIFKKDDHPTEDISTHMAAMSISTPRLQATSPKDSQSLGKFIADSFTLGSLVVPFLLAAAAVVCTFYKMPFQIGIILVLTAGVIILIPILINLREINRKLQK